MITNSKLVVVEVSLLFAR